MKTLFVNITVFAALILIGCQENQITDPVFNKDFNKAQDQATYSQNTIQLDGMLNDPHPVGNSFYKIMGQIQYKSVLVNSNPMIPLSQRYFNLKLDVNAEFKYFCTVCSPSEEDDLAGFISANTEDIVSVTEHFYSTIEKTFTIEGREDGMVLKCRFLVTTRTVELSAMWLALEDDSVIATVN